MAPISLARREQSIWRRMWSSQRVDLHFCGDLRFWGGGAVLWSHSGFARPHALGLRMGEKYFQFGLCFASSKGSCFEKCQNKEEKQPTL